MAKQYTFNNLINGTHHNGEEWVETSLQERQEALHQFKLFLLGYTREGSKPNIAICNMDVVRSLPNTCGIFNRLIIGERGVEYIAGQNYTDEIATIKQIIVKECY
ncbi:hypothetical protein [Bacillus phage BC-T25]|nr:hypothetical protein [Bacillus phage BC-T25]